MKTSLHKIGAAALLASLLSFSSAPAMAEPSLDCSQTRIDKLNKDLDNKLENLKKKKDAFKWQCDSYYS